MTFPRRSFRLASIGSLLVLGWVGAMAACSASTSSPVAQPGVDAAPNGEDASAADPDSAMATDAPADGFVPTGKCADTFGSALTAGFGRIDGTIYAVQKPSDTTCTFPNATHVVLQVLMNSAVYRLVVNVQSDRAGGDPAIRIATLDHALPAPPFSEGWHLPAPLDYVTTLGAHADATFTTLTLDEATTKIVAELKVGDPVAVYGTSGDGRPESAHLIHRNAADQDGAIVISPTTSPKFMLFHFDNQTF
ncbi:MAG: hypothetical protein JWO86_2959 [Myxococcaceae bacterium]|nr:hypothetical protein [Myxococcaceae bacterium]